MQENEPLPASGSGLLDLPLNDLLHILFSRWLLILICVLAAVVPVLVLNQRLPRVYQAETTLVIRNGSDHLNPADLLHSPLDRSFLLNLVEEVRSRSVAEQVLDALPEDARRELLAGRRGHLLDDRTWLLERLRHAVQPELVRDTDVIRIRARARSPELAATLANAVGRVLSERNLHSKRAELSGLRQFIEAQIDTSVGGLRRSEEALNSFKQAKGVVTLEKEAEAILERITKVESELHLAATELTAKRQELLALRRELRREKQDLPSATGEFTSPFVSELKQNLVDLQMRYTKLQLQDYDSNHPELLKLQREIVATRSRIEDELTRIATSSRSLDPMASIPRLVQRQIELQVTADGLDAKVRALQAVRDAYEHSLAQFPDKELALMRLTRSNMLNEKIYMMLLEKREETRIAEAAKIGNVGVLDRAVPATEPVRPRRTLNMLLAALVGLLVGTSVALHTHLAEHVVRTPHELRGQVDLPVLGSVPRLVGPTTIARNGSGSAGAAFPLLLHGSRVRVLPSASAGGEAYRCLRTSLHHRIAPSLPRTLLVTSPGPREGKTTTALNLAVSLALSGVRTCLIDADMRRPALHRALGCDLEPGLANCLEDGALKPLVVRPTAYPDLSLVSAGRSDRNPAELLEMPGLGALVRLLTERYRVLVIDSPPVIPVTDQAILAAHVEAVLLVVYAGRTRLEAVEQAVQTLRGVGVANLYVVMNGLAHPHYYGKYSRYYKDYASSASRRASA